MSATRHANHPLPPGKGFCVSRRILVAGIAAIAGLMPTVGHAAGNVAVSFRTSTLAYAKADVTCSVLVPAASSGIAVLQAAVGKGCIKGFTLQSFGTGHFVDCIDDGVNGNRCGDPAPSYLRYWAMRLNCNLTPYGVDDYAAKAGDELGFSYELLVTAFGVPSVSVSGPSLCT